MRLGFDRLDQTGQTNIGQSKNTNAMANIRNWIHKPLEGIVSEVTSYLLDFTLIPPILPSQLKVN